MRSWVASLSRDDYQSLPITERIGVDRDFSANRIAGPETEVWQDHWLVAGHRRRIVYR